MHIAVHDENSLTNLLFSEIHRLGKVGEFLLAIRWRSHAQLPLEIADVEMHQQVNLSGFPRVVRSLSRRHCSASRVFSSASDATCGTVSSQLAEASRLLSGLHATAAAT